MRALDLRANTFTERPYRRMVRPALPYIQNQSLRFHREITTLSSR
jgi:hypothetical protein